MAGCIFCGTSPTTNAHIFRKAWIDKVFPGTGTFRHRHVRRHIEGFDRTWEADEVDLKVNSACDSCNSGWMNRLDDQAEAVFLDHAVRGYDVRLDRMDDKALVARWCALIAVLTDQVQQERVLGPDEHQALFQGEVPEGTLIWLLRTEPPAWQINLFVEPRGLQFNDPSAHPGHAYLVTFGINHLVAQVFVPTERTPKGVEVDRSGNASILRQLWPAPLTPFIWPPPNSVVWEDMPKLSDAFHGPLGPR
jgi:hypothetical protein